MNGTGNACRYPKSIPVYMKFHQSTKIRLLQHSCKILFTFVFEFPEIFRSNFELNNMSRKTIFYILFFAVLVVGFYFTMNRLIPDFGKSKLPPISRVLPFSFTNQDGKKITENDIAGKVFVAEYFFTTCKSICPIMNGNMMKVYDEFKNEKDFLILSHTSDPGTDSAARLKKYADSLGVNTDKWIFLTGTKDSLYRQARYSYKVDDPNNNPIDSKEDFIHSQFFSLVDKKGNVRYIYDGRYMNEVEKMMKEIEILLKEK